jgi:tetraacyldisaccharide 4'-kinase
MRRCTRCSSATTADGGDAHRRAFLMLDERDLQRVWYAGKPPALALRALAALYGFVAALRRAGYASGVLRARRLSVPVVVVGNITVGGAGKTPLTIALAEALRARGRKPGVVSRGHGGSLTHARLLDANSTPADSGDEPVLILRAARVPVAVGHDRAAAARLLAEAGCDVVLADDGLQHRALARDVEICVIDGERRFGNGRLLPAGPLREPLARLQSVDFRVCNGGSAGPGEVPMTLAGDTAVSVASGFATTLPLADFARRRVHAVAGIGNPARFFALLRSAGLVVDEHAFADHHGFVAGDIDFGDDAPVFMTQKDAVKCGSFAHANVWQVPVRAVLPDDFVDAIFARIAPR